MIKNLCSLGLAILLATSLTAQAPPANNSADIYLQLKKLNVLGSVLYIAAHPDDENTRLLAYFSKEKLYRTGYFSLTRGDGGQNLIGDEQGIELGLIRTQELLAARRIDGAEQFFSRAYDFGFCKTADEALQTWGHDKILSDVVWVIRKFQPDVIITRFPGDPRAGHGHHQASEILANEAFTAAADATKFPEQFAYGVKPWQAKRILWNTFNFGTTNTTDDKQFKMDIGNYNPLLGKSYGEIASESRIQHRSQGFGVPRQRGQSIEYFSLTAGDNLKNDLMDNVDISWNRINGGEEIEKKVNDIIAAFSFEHPENSVAALVELYKSIKQLPDSYWRNKKLDEVQQVIINCSGLFAEATTADAYAVEGDSLHVQFFVNKRNNTNVALKEINFPSYNWAQQKNLNTNENFSTLATIYVPVDQPLSQPYWLQKPLQQGSFDVTDPQLIGKAENDAAYTAGFIFTINGEDFTVTKPLQNKFTDPVKGEVYEPLLVVPAITGHLNQPVYVLDGMKQKNVQLELKTMKSFKQVDVQLDVNNNWTLQNNSINTSMNANANNTLDATATANNSDNANITLTINKIEDYKSQQYTQPLVDERKISYDHIPNIVYFKPLQSKIEKVDVTVKGKNIGYIIGAGDKVPQALQQLGYKVSFLGENDITDENLKQFDAIIAGVRVYNVNDWINSKYEVLMRYIQNGGNYIVQYNTAGFGPTKMKIGPYDFSISRTRVTNENATVDFLLPNTTALNTPNKITAKDFEGWIQERSTYHAEQLDSHYEAPLGMHDANEAQSNGSLIIAKYGKGNFVYTGLVFFRQLPAGIPGAYRLMANLIALPKN